jgi:predicted kinase
MASLSSAGETTSPDATAETVRLTVAQALVKFLGAQYSESDDEEQKLSRPLPQSNQPTSVQDL